MTTTTILPATATLTDPARSAAVYTVRYSIDEYLEWIADDVDHFLATGQPTALADARSKLTFLADRIDAIEQLGRPVPEWELHPELLTR